MGVARQRQYDERFREGFPSPEQRRWIGIAVVAILLAVVAFLIGRATAPITKATPQTQTVTVPATGASRTENGVPVGYQQSKAGATAAATNYIQFIGGPMILEPEKARAALGTLAAPESKQKLLTEFESNLASIQNSTQLVANAARGTKVSVGSYPLAYHVNNYSSTVAEVSIWSVSVVAVDGQLTPTQAWATLAIDLEWTDGDWKVTSDGTTSGPVPVSVAAPVQTKQLPPQLRDYQLFSYAPGS